MIPCQLTRYVVAELLKVFLLTLVAMTLFLALVVVAQEVVRKGLGPGPILQLMPYVLPVSLRFAVPATTLMAVCTVFGRMSADNEIVAIKSLGISPAAVISPALALAFVVSLTAVWLDDLAVSWGTPGMKRVLLVDSVEQIAYGMLRSRRSYATDRFSISVARVDGKRLIQPTLVCKGSDGSPEITLSAKQAQLRRNPVNDTLSVFLTDVTGVAGDHVEVSIGDTIEWVVRLVDDDEDRAMSLSPSNLPLWQIAGQLRQQRTRVVSTERALAARAAYQMLTGDFRGLASDDWKLFDNALASARFRLERLRSEPWRRWANGFSCFFFATVGVPLAIRLRSANFFTTFAACFLPILLVYYPLLQYGVDRAKCGALPPYAVWLGNLICLVVGAALLRRVVRY